MRTLLKVSMDVEAANQALRDGSFQKVIQPVIEKLNPEATYFTAEQGRRTAYIFFQLSDSAQIPQISEPFFLLLRAEVDIRPVMNREELARGLQSWAAGRKAA